MSSLLEYALHVSHLSAQLSGKVTRPTDSKSMKVMKLQQTALGQEQGDL
ncbi:28S ribosomal protein S33, mitochondrial-like [Tupaia chinensis]|nr:28S ribosomal protein S33, mitochondrial-like [Tupaia chinensis]